MSQPIVEERTNARWSAGELAGIVLLVLVLVALVLVPLSPAIQHTPTRDSGIFLYVSSRLLDGDALYRQVWDHKPPLVFWINALGLAFSGHSIWGVWVMQFAFLFLTCLLGYALVRRAFGRWPGAVALSAALLTLSYVLHGGNTTEQYALLFQLGAALGFVKAMPRSRPWGWGAFSGACLALALFTKQSLIAVGMAIGVCLVLEALFTRSGRPLLNLVAIGLGAAAVTGLILGYFAWQHSLGLFWDAAFVYNQAYTNLGLLERLKAVLDELEYIATVPGFVVTLAAGLAGAGLLGLYHSRRLAGLLRSRGVAQAGLALGLALVVGSVGGELVFSGAQIGFGLLQIAAIVFGVILIVLAGLQLRGAWLSAGLERLAAFSPSLAPEALRLLSLAVLWLPLEMILISLSARNFVHYYISLFPLVVILLAFTVYALYHWIVPRSPSGRAVAFACALGLWLAVGLDPAVDLTAQFKPNEDAQISETVRYVEANTRPDDRVLLWGAEPLVNFLSGRRSPSRFVHQGPFYMAGYTTPALAGELLTELEQNRPALIIDVGDDDTPFANRLPSQGCTAVAGELPAGMPQIFAYVCAQYRLEGTVGPDGWKIYRYVGAGQGS